MLALPYGHALLKYISHKVGRQFKSLYQYDILIMQYKKANVSLF